MNQFKGLVYLGILLFIMSTVSADVIINEIMYDPNQCSDTYCEWIELYNNGGVAVNLSGWNLEENGFGSPVIEANGYLVVARKLDGTGDSFELYWGNGDEVWNSSDGFNAVDGNFGTGLSNSGEIVSLTNGNYTNEIDYAPFVALAHDNGYTLARNWSGSWVESLEVNGTPGRANFPESAQNATFNRWVNPSSGDVIVNGLLNITVNISNANNVYVDFNGTNYSMAHSGNIWYYLWNTSLNPEYSSYDITVYYDGDSETLFNITVDNSAPKVTIISPVSLEYYQGIVILNASIADISQLAGVVFELWNESGSNLWNANGTYGGNNYYYSYLNTSNYLDGGYYVYATAWDIFDLTNESQFVEIDIANQIQANAGSDKNVSEGVLVSFNGSASFSSASIVSYFWDFDDGSNSSDVEPTHLFSEDGIYFVTLTITDALNRTSSDIVIVTVNDVNPIANFTMSSDTVYEDNESLVLNASGSYAYNNYDNITEYYWVIHYTFTNKTGTYAADDYYTGIDGELIFNDNGPYTAEITLIVQDEDSNSSITKNVSVLFFNDPIQIEDEFGYVVMGNNMYADLFMNLNDYFDDEETADDDVTFSVSSIHITAAINSSHNVRLTVGDWHGEENITITAYDEDGSSVSQELLVIVYDMPDAPVINFSACVSEPITITDDNFYVLNLSRCVSDADSTDINWTYSTTATQVSVSINNIAKTLTVTPNSGFTGTFDINMTATDGYFNDSDLLTFNVVIGNYPPVIVGTIPDAVIDENETYIIDLTSYESDVDDTGADLTWSLNSVNPNLLSYVINSSEDIITFTPKTYGTDSIFFILKDSEGLTDQQMVLFTVNHVIFGNQTTNQTNQTSGNQTSGNQTSGNQTSGNQTQGNQTSDNQTSIVYSDLIIKEIKVYVDGDKEKNADENGGIINDVKPESKIELKIEIENNGSLEIEDIDVEGIIYDIDDGDDIEEDGDFSDLDPGDDDNAKLEFKIPLEVEDKDFLLELFIEGKYENGTKQKAYVNYTVKIEKEKHDIRILRAALSSSSLECSRTTDLEVKIINLGRDDEDEVRITAKNAELGIDLEKKDLELETDPDDDNTYAGTFNLDLENAKAGTYTIKVTSYYNDDEESDSEDVSITIKDCETKTSETTTETKADITEVVFTAIPSQFKSQPVIKREYTFRDTPLYSLVITIMLILLSGMVILLFGGLVIKKR